MHGHHHGGERDWTALQRAQTRRFAELGRTLTAGQWTAPSLCDGWRNCDVFAHVTLGAITPMPKVLGLMARYRFDVPKLSHRESIALADRMGQSELISRLAGAIDQPVGLAKRIPDGDLFMDNVIHELDVRRLSGIRGSWSEPIMCAALDRLVSSKNKFFAPADNAAGLSFEATDIHWHSGAGPLVAGQAEQIALAIAGRPAGLDDLTGPGVGMLAARLTR